MTDLIPQTSPLFDAKHERAARAELSRKAYENALRSAEDDLEGAPALRRELAGLQGRLDALDGVQKQVDTLHGSVRDLRSKLPTVPAKVKEKQNQPNGVRTLVVGLAAELKRRVLKIDPSETIKDALGGSKNEAARRAVERFLKSQTMPATTTSTGWASELVQAQALGQFYRDLAPSSVFASLMGHARSLDFEGAASLSVPSRPRASEGKLAATWFREGDQIPVKSDALTSQNINRFQLAVISTFSNQLAATSQPNIERVIRTSILDDLSSVLDASILDDTAVSPVRPRGLRANAPSQPSAGNTPANVATDVQWLMGQMLNIRARKPVLIMNTLRALGLQMLFDQASGTFPFAAQIEAVNLFGLPILVSENVKDDLVYVVDAGGLMMARDQLVFDASQAATLVMDDDPAQAVSPDVKSVFQVDATALRMMVPVSWAEVRPGTAYLTGVQW